MSGTENETEALAREVANYIHTTTNPADTLDGISQWWLQHLGKAVPLPKLEKALHLLVEQGKLEKLVLPDNKVVYRKCFDNKQV